MNRKAGIIISLVLALVLTVVIIMTARKDYSTVTRTVEVAKAISYIPVGAIMTEANIERTEVVTSASAGMVSYDEAIGKATSVGILAGQHIYKGSLTDSRPPRKGYVEVLVDTTLARSAYAMPGEKVNIHLLASEIKDNTSYDYSYHEGISSGTEEQASPAPLILDNIVILRVLTSDGVDVSSNSGGFLDVSGGEIAVISLEIPEKHAEQVIHAAANGALYLTKVSLEQEATTLDEI